MERFVRRHFIGFLDSDPVSGPGQAFRRYGRNEEVKISNIIFHSVLDTESRRPSLYSWFRCSGYRPRIGSGAGFSSVWRDEGTQNIPSVPFSTTPSVPFSTTPLKNGVQNAQDACSNPLFHLRIVWGEGQYCFDG